MTPKPKMRDLVINNDKNAINFLFYAKSMWIIKILIHMSHFIFHSIVLLTNSKHK